MSRWFGSSRSKVSLASRLNFVDSDHRHIFYAALSSPAHISWFLPRLNSVISSIPASSPLSISLEIHVTSSSSSSPSHHSPLPLPSQTTLHLLRPSLSQLMNCSIDKILSPCSFCYPICKCGDPENQREGEGICGNSESDCIGNVESGVILEAEEEEVKTNERKEKGAGIDGIAELDQLPSCCQTRASSTSTTTSQKKGGCCSNKSGGKSCCSPSRYPPYTSSAVQEAPVPLRVRNRGGGMHVIVCGPERMTVRFSHFFSS